MNLVSPVPDEHDESRPSNVMFRSVPTSLFRDKKMNAPIVVAAIAKCIQFRGVQHLHGAILGQNVSVQSVNPSRPGSAGGWILPIFAFTRIRQASPTPDEHAPSRPS